MSILGLIVRSRVADVDAIAKALRARPGVDVAQTVVADGRLVVVIEDTPDCAAATAMAQIAQMPQVLNTSLVYEYSGPDAPASAADESGYQAWRRSLTDRAEPQA